MDVSEKNFEARIEADLIVTHYQQCNPQQYDRTLCLLPDDVVDFILATQPQEWDKLKKQYKEDTKTAFLKRLSVEIAKRGTLDVLRKGIKDRGSTFFLAAFRPSSGLNPISQSHYRANIFTAVRQVKYSLKNENSLDMVLFLNGLPIFTAELKNPFKGQTVQDAIHQYKATRDPKEPLFAFGRILSHFAVDPDLVYMTTHLQGNKTRFLPFNRGKYGGAGNVPILDDFATAYLWQDIWQPDSVLDLIQKFIEMIDVENDKGKPTGEQALVFPRYHQLKAVREMVAHAREHGAGQRYLIQHSAGSGKSNTIAWLAHQLSALFDERNERIFDTIIVITDRRVLDRQIQRTVRQFEQTSGVVEYIGEGKTSRDLKKALEGGKNIVISTLQKYPVIASEVQALPGRRFAVIIDEAHSSQSGGPSNQSLKQVLSAASLEQAEAEEADEGRDLEDVIADEMQTRGQLSHVSMFAFTATPKAKTLELFGTQYPDGSFGPFSLYSMRQAIEEGFILDVLQNYTTYKSYFSLLKTISDDPRYDRGKATRLLKAFVDLNDHAIEKKVAIMIEHFADQVKKQIGGKAKAMIVTRSRLHAVRYKLIVDAYLKEHHHDFKALVAFSGTVRNRGEDFTESNMNGFSESNTAEMFKRDEYRILIVANKFQTGFDQPLLHTMYVDKRLGGVHAVQTLSRLNRVYPGKDSTMVLDFANDADSIKASFDPYFEGVRLSEGTDPNLLYDLQTQLLGFDVFFNADVEAFAAIYFNPKSNQAQLHALLNPLVDRYLMLDKDEQYDFRDQLQKYVRLYAFLSQIITFIDTELEKLYVFGRLLLRKLPVSRERLPVEIQQAIDLESYRIRETGRTNISLDRGEKEIPPAIVSGGYVPSEEELETLSQIIYELNRRFGTDFTEDDRVFIHQLEEQLAVSQALRQSMEVNTIDKVRLTFDQVASDQIQDMMDVNFKFYKLVNDDPKFARAFFDWLFDRFMKKGAA